MPKIRDLGINTIPVTMRPVEMGNGGGGDERHRGGNGCPSPTDNFTAECPDDGGLSECHKNTCGGVHTDCKGPTCDDDQPSKDCPPHKQNASGYFTPDAVAQLKQQLESHISQ
ncbi:MAG TPA: hypothetical protein VJZ00_25850 [Thermoanaerobaculia bacterium]|nr:hypothetical protein [Thermoanaerobaculia bacterium]